MELPAQVGRYEIVGRIGRGGMGVVYRARDNALGRLVALKVMTSDLVLDPEAHARFVREARSVATLQHPNIVVIYELGEHDGGPFIAMEFLDGDPLDRLIRTHAPLSALDKIGIIYQVAKGLQYAHDKGVIHRDIKPANIMRLRDGSVKVVDFGIAHLADQTITKTGMVLGSLAYLAPEQLNSGGIDRRTDIFSLGVVLYQLFSGKLPFEGANTAEVMMKILLGVPRPLAAVGTLNPPELQPILDKALAKRKEERYQSCSEMAEAMARLRGRLEREARSGALDRERQRLPPQPGQERIAVGSPVGQDLAARRVKQTLPQASRRHPATSKQPALMSEHHGRLWLYALVLALIIATGTYVVLLSSGPAQTKTAPTIAQTEPSRSPDAPSATPSSGEVPPPQRPGTSGLSSAKSHQTARQDKEPTSAAGGPTKPSATTPVNVASAIGDLGVQSEVIANTSSEVEVLKHKGDRNYYEFTVHKGTIAQVSTVSLELKKVDAKKSRFTLNVIADDKTIEKKDRTVGEALQFYTGRNHLLYWIVVFSADKNSITGYLSMPKNAPILPTP